MKQYLSNTWILNNYKIFWRVLNGFSRALFFRQNTLKVVEIYPTFRCNSKCLMCSVAKFRNENRAELALSDYKSIAEQAAKMGAIAVSILGGEPLLSDDIEGIISLFQKNGFFVSMVSNSFGFSEEKAKSLKEAGLNSVYFSLESVNAEDNDNIRGIPGHYESVMNAIRVAKLSGIRVGLAGVIFPKRVDRFVELLDFCKERDLLCSGGEIAPVGAASDTAELVSDADNKAIKKLLGEYRGLTFDWGLSYFLKFRCPAGKEKIGITAYGDVIGCSLNPISFGNILSEPLKIIWDRIGKFSQFKKQSARCISAGDLQYIKAYIKPLSKFAQDPIDYRLHPLINKANEPELFK